MNSRKEAGMRYVFLLSAGICILAVALICLFLLVNALPALREIGLLDFLCGSRWKPSQNQFGIFPMILGSLYVTAGAIIVGVPLGLLCALFLSHFCPQRCSRLFRGIIHFMAGVPSIVYGFFGLVILVPLMQHLTGVSGKNILTVSILLGVMILPTVIMVAESALRAVPPQYYEGALALGATRERAAFRVVLPAARSGVSAGIVLGVSRAIGEALAVSMVAGNQAVVPGSLLSGVRTLTANIVLEMGYASGLHRSALIATGVVLFFFILAIDLLIPLTKKGAKP